MIAFTYQNFSHIPEFEEMFDKHGNFKLPTENEIPELNEEQKNLTALAESCSTKVVR